MGILDESLVFLSCYSLSVEGKIKRKKVGQDLGKNVINLLRGRTDLFCHGHYKETTDALKNHTHLKEPCRGVGPSWKPHLYVVGVRLL